MSRRSYLLARVWFCSVGVLLLSKVRSLSFPMRSSRRARSRIHLLQGAVRIASSENAEGGKSLVGQERCRLRMHNGHNLAPSASRTASHGRHHHITIRGPPVCWISEATAYTGWQLPWP